MPYGRALLTSPCKTSLLSMADAWRKFVLDKVISEDLCVLRDRLSYSKSECPQSMHHLRADKATSNGAWLWWMIVRSAVFLGTRRLRLRCCCYQLRLGSSFPTHVFLRQAS